MAYLMHYINKVGEHRNQWLYLRFSFRKMQRRVIYLESPGNCLPVYDQVRWVNACNYTLMIGHRKCRKADKPSVDKAQEMLSHSRRAVNTWILLSKHGVYAIIIDQLVSPLSALEVLSPFCFFFGEKYR